MDILLPLRYFHGWLHKWSTARQQAKEFSETLKVAPKSAVLIPGTPLHTNLGDSAIVIAQKAFLRRCGIEDERIVEVSFPDQLRYRKVIKGAARSFRLITQLGGGNMGSQWLEEELLHRRITQDFPRHPMIIFPQTIYYTPDEEGQKERRASIPIYNGHKKLTMVARERRSFQIMKELYPDTNLLLIPDIVLSADMDTFGVHPQPRQGVLMCMRSDAERSMTDEERAALEAMVRDQGMELQQTDTHSATNVTAEQREEMVREKLEQIAGTQLLITDRLHGMVFAAITGTPCIVFGNYNHKVKGTYEWISHLPYICFVNNREEAKQCMPRLLEMRDCRYDKVPLEPYFEKLAEVVRQCL